MILLYICLSVETIQKTAILETARMLEKALETKSMPDVPMVSVAIRHRPDSCFGSVKGV